MALLGSPGMGIGRIGAPDVIFKRAFRFEFQITTPNGTVISPNFVKEAARPNISFEDVELNYLNEKTWIPGKGTWETITVTYLDAAVSDLQPLYNWLASVYDFTSTNRNMGSRRGDYEGRALLYIYDGCGQLVEEWRLGNLWPQAVNFGTMPYESNDVLTIELTLRYSNVVYISHCPAFTPAGICSPCGT